MVLYLLPVGLLLLGAIFLRRRQRGGRTRALQSAAAAWFIAAIVTQLALNPAVGFFRIPNNIMMDTEGAARLQLYTTIASALTYLELALFITFAVVFLLYARRGTERLASDSTI